MPILETEEVIKQYRQSDEVITAVNRATLQVEDGEFVAIMGASGSGKSTLLHLCAGLTRPNAGRISIRGQDITAMKPDALARFRGQYIGIVFQSHNLIPHLTALENIRLPAMICEKERTRYEETEKYLLRVLKIGDRIHHLPAALSGGQRQRVAIARALINRPQVLFADEPTGNLDRANADEVLELLLKMQKEYGQTLVMVTHDSSIAKRADRVLEMKDGYLSKKDMKYRLL